MDMNVIYLILDTRASYCRKNTIEQNKTQQVMWDIPQRSICSIKENTKMKVQLIEMPGNFLGDFHIKDCIRTSTLFPLENSFTKYSSSSQNKFKRRIRQLDKAGASEVSNLFQLQRIQRDYDLFVETSLYFKKLLRNTVLISEALKVEQLRHCYVCLLTWSTATSSTLSSSTLDTWESPVTNKT